MFQKPFILFFLFSFAFLTLHSLHAQENTQEQNILSDARAYLKLSKEEALKHSKKITPENAEELLTQVRFISRQTNPQIDHVYFLLQKLENRVAVDLSQRRLQNLLWVIGLTLFFFSCFLIYIIYAQHKNFASVQQLLKAHGLDLKKTSNSSLYIEDL